MKTYSIFINAILLFLLWSNKSISQNNTQFVMVAKISNDSFFNKEIASKFMRRTSNEMGKYCPLSFDFYHEYIYIPSRNTKEIKAYTHKKAKINYQHSVKTENTPDFISINNEQELYYSSISNHKIYLKKKLETSLFKTKLNPYFKNSNGNLIYCARFWFFNSKNSDSIYYSNINIDWDYFYTDTEGYSFLYVNHDENNKIYIENPKKDVKIKIDSRTHYDTYKIAGVYNNNIILILSNAQEIELIYCDTKTLKIVKKIKLNTPFHSELMMGDASIYWPNQYIYKLRNNKLYLLGTTRRNIEVYSIDL